MKLENEKGIFFRILAALSASKFENPSRFHYNLVFLIILLHPRTFHRFCLLFIFISHVFYFQNPTKPELFFGLSIFLFFIEAEFPNFH